MRYYARLNPAKVDEAFLNREEVVRMSDVGAQLGFGLSVLHERGLVRDPSSLDAQDGLPLVTWPFLDFLDSLELSQETVLELGAGNSTLWLQRRFARVRSFETDPAWQAALSKRVAANVELCSIALASLEAAEVQYRDESFVLVDFAGRRTRFLVKRAVLTSDTFKQLTLPRRVSVPLFSRYDEGMEYGAHTDDAYRSSELLRTAVTLFLSVNDLMTRLSNPVLAVSLARIQQNLLRMWLEP